MFVLQLLDKFKFGGGERVALTYMDTINELEIENIIIAREGGRTNEFHQLKLTPNYLAYLLKIIKCIKAKPTSRVFIISHTNRALLAGLLCKVIFHKKIKLIYVQHIHYSEFKLKFITSIHRLLFKYIQITPITSNSLQKFLPAHKMFYVNNYLSMNSYSAEATSSELRKFMAFKNDRKAIVFIGRVTKEKNPIHLVELLSRLPSKQYCGLLLGSGEALKDVKSSMNRLDINNIYLAGFQESPLTFLGACDYMYFSSSYSGEMMPMAVLEAKALNCKVIGYKGDLNSYIIPKENLFDFEDFSTIAQAIKDDITLLDGNKFDEKYGRSKLSSLFK
jgi:glycosyltransferase involved in cell wall biosynthesis